MRVLVCGGRDYGDERKVNAILDRIHVEHPISVVIQGGAAGADQLARAWSASERGMYEGIQRQSFRADWQKHGKAAGPIRNQRMIDEGNPDLVVAFPGGRGTADMVRRARAAGLRVIEVE